MKYGSKQHATTQKIIEWLADTGSHRSFINQSTAKKLMTNNPNIKIERYNENERYRCFNNKEIKIKGLIH